MKFSFKGISWNVKYFYFSNLITWFSEICLTSLIALFWNFPLFWNFLLMICNFPLLFSHPKNIRMSTLITIIVIYQLLIIIVIITKSRNNYCRVGVKELCLLHFLILIDCFLCNPYPCLLFESLFVISGENLPRSFFEVLISKFQKSELAKFIPYFPLKLMITNTNFLAYISHQQQKNCVYREEKFSGSENMLTHFFQMHPFSTLPPDVSSG